MTSYVSSIIPIIVAGWILSYLERGMDKILPTAIRNFTKPLISLFVMVPLVLILIGPISAYASHGVAAGINYLFGLAPWLGGALMGGLWQILVIFGLHWGLVPVFVNDLTTVGHSLLAGPTIAAVLAQGAATLGVFVRTKDAKRRQVAGPAAFSGIMAGVTEPAIYGVNLPLKRPLYFGVIGGAIIGLGGGAANVFVVPSTLALPAYIYVGNFALTVLGCVVSMTVAFGLTFFFVDRESPDARNQDVSQSGTGNSTVSVASPVSGQLIALDQVPDKVFASQALGKGVGIIPQHHVICSPLAGKIISVAPSGHAFGVRSDEGVEVLVHIGIDTVELKGQHFKTVVRKGAVVAVGDELSTVDFAALESAGYDTTVIVTVTNTSKLQEVTPVAAGSIEAQKTIVTVIP